MINVIRDSKLFVICYLLFYFFIIANVQAEEIKHHDVTFQISGEMKVKYPELIKLILVTESMDDKERQYWFDILPSMTDSQVDRLFEIVETERKKLSELEKKYQKEIKDLNEKHLKEWQEFQQKSITNKINTALKGNKKKLFFILFDDSQIPKIKIAQVINDKVENIYLPNNGSDKFSSLEHMALVEFGKKILENIDTYKSILGEDVFKGYIDKIIDSAISVDDLETLASIQKNKLADNDLIAKKLYLAKGDYNSLASLYEKKIETEKLTPKFLLEILELTKWRKKENCKDKCELVLKKYFQKMLEADYPFKHREIKNSFQVDLIILDIVMYFNEDLINKELRNKIKGYIEFYVNNDKAYADIDKDWYFTLTTSFFSNSINSVYESKLDKFLRSDNPYDIEGQLLEVSVYTAFDLIKNHNEDKALQILLKSKGLGNSIYSKAYKYIEKDLVDFFMNVAIEPHKYIKGNNDLVIPIAKGANKVEKNTKNIEESKPFNKKYALIIGVSDYKNLSPQSGLTDNNVLHDLHYADKDAQAFQKFLNTPEVSGGKWQIEIFTENKANAVEIMKKIDDILSHAGDDDLIYIFFSGHGRLNPNNSEEVYLLTYDFELDNPYSGIPYSWLISAINKTKAVHLIAFIDACKSGTIKNSKGEQMMTAQDLSNAINKIQSPTKVIFSSASGSQVSYEDEKLKGGIFTHFLLNGLYGEAEDFNKDGFVNLSELYDYTTKQVEKYTKETKKPLQRPDVSKLEPSVAVEFPLSIKR